MVEHHTLFAKPYVVVIAGYVGSGKSTVAASLSTVLDDAPILVFDHYEKYIEWPHDMNQWMLDGADLDQIRIPKLKEDLLSLLKGITIIDPFDGKILAPSKYILLEEPSGGAREEIKAYIDFIVYIDVPQDVCVTRLVERLIDMDLWNTKGTFGGETNEDLVRQLNAVASWITHYQRARSMYMIGSQMVHQKADIVIDGLLTVEEITNDILNGIKDKCMH
jgi:energy-coupling factor transporter ATP-binding protein EcfA2